MKIRLAYFFILFLLGAGPPSGPTYHKVPALPGDGVYSLLRRYQLERHSCNHAEFYRINNLKKNAALQVGKYYQIPVLLYTFNGNTIRSSIGVDDWNLAKSIEAYNEKMLGEGLLKESFKSSKVLWVPFHLLNCPAADMQEEAPTASRATEEGELDLATAGAGSRRFPIFGKDFEYVPLQDNKLAGKVYYIVAGHGGPDPGAMGKRSNHSLCEDEYAYDVGLRLARILLSHGATTYIIVRDPNDGIRGGQFLNCDEDEVVWGNKKIPYDQKQRLFQRSDMINELYEKHKKQGVTTQVTIEIHVDSRSKREQTDLFFYYHPSSTSSKNLATRMQETMKKKYKQYRSSGQYYGTVSSRDLHTLRETKTTSVYVELGNIRNSFDQQRIVIESNRQALANWLYEGLL